VPAAVVQQRQDRLQARPDPAAEDLDAEHVAQPVGDEPAQSVAFGMHQPVCVGNVVEAEQAATQIGGPGDPLPPERLVERAVIKTEHTQRDLGCGIVDSATDHRAGAIQDAHAVAGFRVGRRFAEHLLIDEDLLAYAAQADPGRRGLRGGTRFGHGRSIAVSGARGGCRGDCGAGW
jgi:hypothetical protein